MIEGLKPYAEYKESGAPWFGNVPKHWNVERLGAVFGERGETNDRREVTDILSVMKDKGVIPYAEKGRVGNKASDDIGRYKIVRPVDLVVNCMNVIIGSVGRSRFTGCLSPVYYVFKRRKLENDPRFLELVFQHKQFQQSLVRIGNGILAHRMRIPMEKLKAELFPLPPLDEQAAIVRFLDHANRKIDGFIRAKRKLIGLLNEQKQAIIHRAVTRGLNPDVRLKPSGIPWLAEAPSNWTWIPIKLLLSHIDYGTSEKSTASGNIRILTMGNIQKGEVTVPRSGGLNYLPDSLLLQHHDLLFTRTNGNPNLVGKVGIFRGDISDRISFASYLVRLRVKRFYDPEWLHMVLNSAAFWPFARSHALVNLQTNLNSTRYGQFAVPVPPLTEQKEIVKWIGGESINLNTAISRTEREIALMQEYRTRLTADIVTGKLDVREAAAKLPEVAAEPNAETVLEENETEEGET